MWNEKIEYRHKYFHSEYQKIMVEIDLYLKEDRYWFSLSYDGVLLFRVTFETKEEALELLNHSYFKEAVEEAIEIEGLQKQTYKKLEKVADSIRAAATTKFFTEKT